VPGRIQPGQSSSHGSYLAASHSEQAERLSGGLPFARAEITVGESSSAW